MAARLLTEGVCHPPQFGMQSSEASLETGVFHQAVQAHGHLFKSGLWRWCARFRAPGECRGASRTHVQTCSFHTWENWYSERDLSAPNVGPRVRKWQIYCPYESQGLPIGNPSVSTTPEFSSEKTASSLSDTAFFFVSLVSRVKLPLQKAFVETTKEQPMASKWMGKTGTLIKEIPVWACLHRCQQ